MRDDPHAGGRLLRAGRELKEAEGVVILLHGRGASGEDIMGLRGAIGHPGLAYLAPEAAGLSWYPNSFLAAREGNEPGLSSALRLVETMVEGIREASGLSAEKIVLMGFSQGACLSTEYVATRPARYAGVVGFTGGLIGPLGSELSGSDPAHAGELAGTPVFLGSGDPDPHVPWGRVEETAEVLRRMGAEVTLRRYPGRPHTVSGDEIGLARALVYRAFPAA